jgi:hypothetical protein
MSTRNLPEGAKGGQRIRLTTLLPSVSRLSRKCGSLDLSQPFELPWPVTGMAVPFYIVNTNGAVFEEFLCNPSTDFMAAHWLLHLKYSEHMMSMIISNSSLSMTEVFISHRVQETQNGK